MEDELRDADRDRRALERDRDRATATAADLRAEADKLRGDA